MQQELIEMLDKMVKYFDEIPSDSYYYRETAAILGEAEKLVEKAKNSAKEPAVKQGWKLVPVEPTSEMLSAVGKEMSWYNPVGIFRKMLAATPAAQSQPVTLTDAWLLEQFKHHPNWELSTSNDPECDPSVFWLVHEVKGSRNDREWFLIGEGESPCAAIIAALREKEQA